MNLRMHEWIYVQMNECEAERMSECTYICMNYVRLHDEWMNVHMYEWMNVYDVK